MENKVVDFAKVEEGSGFISKPGEYTLTIKKVTNGVSPQKGTEYHEFTCETAEKESIKFKLFLTETSMWKYKLLLKAVGAPTDQKMNLDELPSKLTNKTFIGVVVNKDVEKIDPLTGAITVKQYVEVNTFKPIK